MLVVEWARPVGNSGPTAQVAGERLRSATILAPTITVSGHASDVTTGLITTILSAAPRDTSPADPAGTTVRGR